MIPQMIQALRDLVGEGIHGHYESVSDECAVCRAEALLTNVGAVALLQTDPADPASGFLVTLWPDGTGELAARADDHRWGPPVPLQPAP